MSLTSAQSLAVSEEGEAPFDFGRSLQVSIEEAAAAHSVEALWVTKAIQKEGREWLEKKYADILGEPLKANGEYQRARGKVIELLWLRGYENVEIAELSPSLEGWLDRKREVSKVSGNRHEFVIETPFAQTGVLKLSSKRELSEEDKAYIETLAKVLSLLRLRQHAEIYNKFLPNAELLRLLDASHEQTARYDAIIFFVDTSDSTLRQTTFDAEGRPQATASVIAQETLGPAMDAIDQGLREKGNVVLGAIPGDAFFEYLLLAENSPKEEKVQAAVKAIETAITIQERLQERRHEEEILQTSGKVVISFGLVDVKIIGKPTDAQRGLDFIGGSINTASRMEKLAGAGQILIVYDNEGVAEKAVQEFKAGLGSEQEVEIVEYTADPARLHLTGLLKGIEEPVKYALITIRQPILASPDQ